MLLYLIRPLRYLWKAVTSERTPRQIAWGVALGLLVGIIPKGNLTAWCCGIVMLATRVNLGAGMLTALAVSAFGPRLDPLTHGLGLRLLSTHAAQALMMRWHDAALLPWFSLNNTVVLGSVVLGLAILYPAKHLVELTIVAVRPRLTRTRASTTCEAALRDASSSRSRVDAPSVVAELESTAATDSALVSGASSRRGEG